jgi:hypothetical protein
VTPPGYEDPNMPSEKKLMKQIKREIEEIRLREG